MRFHKSALCVAIGLALGSAEVMAAVTVNQYGDSNTASASQAGTAGSDITIQQGWNPGYYVTGNSSTVSQTGDVGTAAYTYQYGNSDTATLTQSGNVSSYAYIQQYPDWSSGATGGNLATLDQNGNSGSSSSIYQGGASNTASVIQDNNSSSWAYNYQYGSKNTTAVTQASNTWTWGSAWSQGNGNTANVNQQGNYETQGYIGQQGDGNFAQVDQYGNTGLRVGFNYPDGTYTWDQWTTGAVSQQGNANWGYVYQSGNQGSYAAIQQVNYSDGNSAAVGQYNTGNSLAEIRQGDYSWDGTNTWYYDPRPDYWDANGSGSHSIPVVLGPCSYCVASAYQTGVDQTSRIFQGGIGNNAYSYQDGNFNESMIVQTGDKNIAGVVQSGDAIDRWSRNMASISQNGSANTAYITQTLGQLKVASINQVGSSNSASITQ